MTQSTQLCLLVVDDEQDICDMIAELLRHEFRVLKAGGAAEGLRVMQENEVHIIITDQKMPRTTGLEFLTSVQVRYPQAVRMLYSSYMEQESLLAAINQGQVFRFLKKPCAAQDLEAAARDASVEHVRLVELSRI